ncbi:MAG TPA: hypothetical protein VFS12_05355, partial [Terriglobia bacterium]|nr:hypothetical protein [Terriglobia bacterium]
MSFTILKPRRNCWTSTKTVSSCNNLSSEPALSKFVRFPMIADIVHRDNCQRPNKQAFLGLQREEFAISSTYHRNIILGTPNRQSQPVQ